MTQLQMKMEEVKMGDQVKTMYEKHQAVFDRLKDKFPNIAAVSKVTTSIEDMDTAVGSVGGGCVAHWIRGDNDPGGGSENRAGSYLKSIANNHQAPVAAPAATVVPAQTAAMYMISVPQSAKAKADMLLNMLRNINCEVVDF
jgi:hypothetical protein